MASPHRASPKQLPEDDASYPTESLESQSDRLLDYDFVEEPSQDYFCPVSLSVLQDPHQSTCCGHHFSKEVALQLQQAGKPCPMCKEPDLTLVVDKFYKRKINELNVRCPHKGSGCDWVGELGKFEHHVSSCPKRPWECEHCDFKATYEVYGDHVPLCTKYPIPCPNQCEIVTVPRSNLEKHLSECPLQLVECEFSQAGCTEKVPRRDLVSHVRENVQQHLLSMSLLNLTLTRELREKMEEKDGQIAELQEELKRQGKEIEQRDIDHEAHLQLVEKRVQEQGQQLQDQMHHLRADVLSAALHTVTSTHEFSMTGFNLAKRETWNSEPFYSHERGYKFQLQVMQTSSLVPAETTHWNPQLSLSLSRTMGMTPQYVSADIKLLEGEFDEQLLWPIRCTAHLLLLNQLTDSGHYGRTCSQDLRKKEKRATVKYSGFIRISDLSSCFNDQIQRHTQYLMDDCIRFRLHLSVALIH